MKYILLQEFMAQRMDDAWSVGIALLVSVVALGVALYLYKKPIKDPVAQRYRQMGWLLCLIFAMMGIFTAVFSGWSYSRASPVKLQAEKIITPYGTLAYEDVRQLKITTDQSRSPFNQMAYEPARLLVIEGPNQKTHVLSSRQYEVDKIMRALKQKLAEKTNQ